MNKVGAIGFPIEHSLSPVMHNAAFAALGMTDWLYEKFAIPPDILKVSLREFKDHGFIGMNVTVPHKETVMAYVKPDALAQAVGAVNTITFRGYQATNTDVVGFMDDLRAHGVNVDGETVLLLGAGGAGRAAAYGLAEAGAHLSIYNRTRARAERLITDLSIRANIVHEHDLESLQPSLIVSTTSVGMSPDVNTSPLPVQFSMNTTMTVYDMVYRPRRTRLLQDAELAGARAISGLGMLVRQGAASFRIWTGVEPPIDVLFAAVEKALSE